MDPILEKGETGNWEEINDDLLRLVAGRQMVEVRKPLGQESVILCGNCEKPKGAGEKVYVVRKPIREKFMCQKEVAKKNDENRAIFSLNNSFVIKNSPKTVSIPKNALGSLKTHE